MSPHRLSLAQQIAELDEPAPADFDPEDELRGSPNLLGDVVEAREHYIEVGPSTLRRHLDSVLEPKYVGIKTSRKQLEEENSLGTVFADSPEQGESASQYMSSEGSTSEEDEKDEKVQSPGKKGEASEGEQSSPRNYQGIQEDPSHVKDLATTVRQRRDEDRIKGRAVTKQLSLWDSLLDARIRLQRSVTASNRLPSPTELSEFTFHRRCLEARHALLGESLALVDELSALREGLMEKEKEAQWQPRKRRRLQDGEQGRRYAPREIDNVDRDWDALIREASEDAAGLDHAYHAHLTRTLEKWSAKVAAVAPSALLPASRKRFSLAGSMKEGVKGVGTQIEDMFQSGWPAFLSRTRLKRCTGAHVTSEEGAGSDEDEEVFDDTDFYQQLLRDVIVSKGGGSGQLMAGQRQKKSKKKVDTRASKGRKLRYEVHEKIQNFMVPVPHHAGAWHEAQIDELFASLLGKGFTMT